MLTIGVLARYVGVTPRTVRFYHQRGLLPEPERDASGYRSYDAEAVITLSRVSALARSGVPLARIKELVDAPAEEFRGALVDIDAQLQKRIAELRADRRRLASLESSERLCLPPVLAEFMEKLRAQGVAEDLVTRYRDAWILCLAMFADLDEWLASPGARQFSDPSFLELLVRTFALVDAAPEDPRVTRLAADTVAWSIAHWDIVKSGWDVQMLDRLANDVMTEHWHASLAWARIDELVEAGMVERGYSVATPRSAGHDEY